MNDVSFAIEAGETFGLVGESGSGKTTTARALLRLVEPTSGEVWFRGQNVVSLGRGDLREMRRHMQIVFQDPHASLNPRMHVGQIVREPLDIHRLGSAAERRDRVAALFTLVGLDPSMAGEDTHASSAAANDSASALHVLWRCHRRCWSRMNPSRHSTSRFKRRS